MGLFGSKHTDEPEEYMHDDQQAASVSIPQANIDGVIASGGAPVASQDSSFTQTPPTVAVDDDTPADYIMADPPMPAPQDTEENAEVSEHIHEDELEPGQEPIGNHQEFYAEPEPEEPAAQPVVVQTEPAAPSNTVGDLVTIKQEALKQLSPLVSHLDQSPEEKFHTTMMMLQATDDQTLVKPAYEAAQAITDDKTRAQALLDIVNEINYFTQKS